MTTIDCRAAVSRMWAYLSRDLERQDSTELEEHLGVCLRCCGELEFSRELRSRMAETGEERIPTDVQARIDNLLDGGNAPSGGTG